MPTHEVTHHGGTLTAMQLPQHFLDGLVISGDAFVLAQVLQPRRGHEILQVDAWTGHVLDHAPDHRAIAAADRAQRAHLRLERGTISTVDAVLDGDQHRAAIVRHRHRQLGCGPVPGRTQVQILGASNPHAPHQQSADHRTCGSHQQRQLRRGALCQRAPAQATGRHAGREHHDVQRQRTRTYPCRHRRLRGDLQRRQHGDPGEAIDQHHSRKHVPAAGQRQPDQAERQRQRGQQHQQVAIQLRAQLRQQQGPAHCTDTDAAQQHAVLPRPTLHLAAYHHRQQCIHRRSKEEEAHRLDQHGLQASSAAGIAQARLQPCTKAFRWQAGLLGITLPAPHHEQHRGKGDGIEAERPHRTQLRHDHATNGRADRAGDVDADRVQRHRRGQHRLRHQLGHDRGLRRHCHRCTATHAEGQQYQQLRSQHVHRSQRRHHGRDQQHPALGRQQVPAAIDDVGQRSGGECQQHDRHRGGRLHQRHHQRRTGTFGHDPGGRHVIDPGADVAGQDRQPDRAEHLDLQRGPGTCGLYGGLRRACVHHCHAPTIEANSVSWPPACFSAGPASTQASCSCHCQCSLACQRVSDLY